MDNNLSENNFHDSPIRLVADNSKSPVSQTFDDNRLNRPQSAGIAREVLISSILNEDNVICALKAAREQVNKTGLDVRIMQMNVDDEYRWIGIFDRSVKSLTHGFVITSNF